jgi:hypothetical protein
MKKILTASNYGSFGVPVSPNGNLATKRISQKLALRDRHWIIKLSNIDRHRDWLIITKDKGAKDKRDRDKLPRICKRHNYAYLIVSRTLRRADSNEGRDRVGMARLCASGARVRKAEETNKAARQTESNDFQEWNGLRSADRRKRHPGFSGRTTKKCHI